MSGRPRDAERLGRCVCCHDTLGKQRSGAPDHHSHARQPGEPRSRTDHAGRLFREEVRGADGDRPLEPGRRQRSERCDRQELHRQRSPRYGRGEQHHHPAGVGHALRQHAGQRIDLGRHKILHPRQRAVALGLDAARCSSDPHNRRGALHQDQLLRDSDPRSGSQGEDRRARGVGWWAMYASGLDQANGFSAATSDYNIHGKTYYYPWLLQQLQAYKQQTGTQLIDIFTVHGYSDLPDGSDDSASGQQLRNRQTRILWDPNYQDPEWYGDIGINGRVIDWIPSLKAMVNQDYPGLPVGITEYNWGDEANLNGATTQADALGIFGREGLDLATRWTVPTNPSPTYLAMQIYRNYDGKLSTFGDTSVSAGVSNPDSLSSFAAMRASDGALTVMVINKQTGSTPVTI